MADQESEDGEDTTERRMSLRKRKIQKYVGEDSPPSKSQKRKDSYAKEIQTLEAKGLLKEFREKEAIRQQLYRASMSDDKRKVYNEKTKERMRKYREKLKNNVKSSNSNRHVLTRKEKKMKAEEQTKKRLYWRVKQQESRARQTDKKKQEINEKRKANYALKNTFKAIRRNLEDDFDNDVVTEVDTVNDTVAEDDIKQENTVLSGKEDEHLSDDRDYNSTSSARKAIHRYNNRLPKTPRKWLRVVGGVLKRATPRKLRLLKTSGLVSSPNSKMKNDLNESIADGVKEHLRCTRKKNTSRKGLVATIVKHAKKTCTNAFIRHSLGIKWTNLVKMSSGVEDSEIDRKKRCDALSEDEVLKIHEFYQQPQFAVEIPARKLVSKKTLLSKSVLTRNTKEIHESYLKQKDSVKIGLDKFRKLRPKHVLTANKTQLRQCLCEYCTNVENKLKVLNACQSVIKYKDAMAIVNDSLCPKGPEQEYNKLECIERKCKECGVESLTEKIANACKDHNTLTWERWENRKTIVKGTIKTKKDLVSKNASTKDFIEELIQEVAFLSQHLFVASWQYHQFNELKKHLQADWVLLVADFAENYRTFYQDEIQAAHWQYQQITVHPIVAYYKCPEKQCTDTSLVTESIVCISDDLTHDASAVHKFFETAFEHLQKSINIKHAVQFTDGCSAQYKSKEPFMDLSYADSEYNFEIDRNFFGSRHGKGPCDGLGAVTKQGVARAVQRREAVIRNAEEMFNYCKDNMEIKAKEKAFCCHKQRTFYLVQNVPRNRQSRRPKNSCPGTRQLHSVKGIEPGIIATRNLSCFCQPCLTGLGRCSNDAYVSEWREFQFKIDQTKSTKTRNSTENKKPGEKKNGTKKKAVEKNKERPKRKGTETVYKTPKNTDKRTGPESHKGVNKDGQMNRIQFFKDLQETMKHCKTYDELVELCMSRIEECRLYKIEGSPSNLYVLNGRFEVDEHSLEIAPVDVPGVMKIPVKVKADGNCLPRTGSVFVFGHERFHQEIRVRIVMELVINQNRYLDNTYLKQCTNLRGDLAKNYAQYSDFYVPGICLTDIIVERIYEEEAKRCCKMGEYMGIWQIFALANIIDHQIMSVYPEFGQKSVRADLHRFIPTQHATTHEIDTSKEVNCLLWTSTRSDMNRINWVPNHFTPLLPIEQIQEENFELSERSNCVESENDASDPAQEQNITDHDVKDNKDKTLDNDKPENGESDTPQEQNIEDHDMKEDKIEDQDVKEDSIENQDVKEDSIENQDVKEDSIENQDVKEDSIANQDVKEDSFAIQDVKEDSIENQDVKEDGIENQDVKEDGIEDQNAKGDSIEDHDVKDMKNMRLPICMRIKVYGLNISNNTTKIGHWKRQNILSLAVTSSKDLNHQTSLFLVPHGFPTISNCRTTLKYILIKKSACINFVS